MCIIAGCQAMPGGGKTARAWTTLCNRHRSRERRHGDANQEPILANHLKPYLRSLTRRQKANPNAPAWDMLTARWRTLVDQQRDTVRAFDAGLAGVRWRYLAAKEIVRVAVEPSAEDAWRTAVAMFLFREHEPTRFVSDKAFLVQLSRRVRHLSTINRGSYYDHVSGGTKLVWRDPNTRVAVLIGQALADTFGAAGVFFADQERKEADSKQAERNAFYDALKGATMGQAA